MAKKKVSASPPQSTVEVEVREAKPTKPQQKRDQSTEKMENLKTLNGLLVKETMETREQMRQLKSHMDELSADQSLLSGLERSVSQLILSSQIAVEKDRWRKEAEEWVEAVDGLEEEKAAVERRLAAALEEKDLLWRSLEDVKEVVEMAKREKAAVEKALDGAVAEVEVRKVQNKGLEGRIFKLERKVVEGEEAVGRAQMEYQMAVAEKEEIEKGFVEKTGLVEDLKREMGVAVRGKEAEMEAVKIELVKKVSEAEMAYKLVKESEARLVDEVGGLREEIGLLKEMGEANCLEVAGLEKRNGELQEMVGGLDSELEAVKGEMAEKVSKLEEAYRFVKESEDRLVAEVGRLKEEIGLMKKMGEGKSLEVAAFTKRNMELEDEIRRVRAELDEQIEEKREKVGRFELAVEEKLQEIEELKWKLEVVVGERIEIEQVRIKQDSEIVEMQKEIEQLTSTVSKLQVLGRDQGEENKVLIADKVALQKSVDQKNEEGKGMKKQIKELQKSKALVEKELGQLKKAHDGLVQEKKKKENDLQSLMEEKALVEKNLEVARRELKDMEKKMKAARSVSEQALAMVKNTVKAVSNAKGGKNGVGEEPKSDMVVDEEIMPLVAELESVKKVYRSRGEEMEVMKQELQMLQESMAVAKKRGGFWAWMTSATTAIAALSVAYVAKSR